METTRDFLERLREKHGGCSWYRVGKILGVAQSAVVRWKHGKGFVSRDIALQIAAELGEAPEYVIACVELEREPSPAVRPAWERIAAAFGPGVAAGITAAVLVAPQAQAVVRGDCILWQIARRASATRAPLPRRAFRAAIHGHMLARSA